MSAALAWCALTAAPALADEAASGPTFTGNIALATDYTFRGLSQTEGAPAVQGGFDMSYGLFYAGTWASSVDFTEFGVDGSLELDLYAGFKPTLGPVALDLGVIGYLYPGSSDLPGPTPRIEGELDYFEGYVKASVTPAEGLSLGAAGYLSPEFTGETGQAYYLEANAAFTATPALAFSGAVGLQSIDDVSGVFPGSFDDEYVTWNLGATLSGYGFTADLRYVDTSIEARDPIIVQAFTTAARGEGRAILTVKRSF